jgi:hypothetical protein
MQVSRARANNTVKVLRAMLKQHGVNDVVVTGKGVGVWPSRSSSRLQNRVEVFVG